MNLSEIEIYLSAKKIKFHNTVIDRLADLKNDAKKSNNELLTNKIWCLETIYIVQEYYVRAFNFLKEDKFFEAWRALEEIDIQLSFLRRHFDYSNNEFNLKFIEKTIRYYEKLFPYEYFTSRESIVKKQKCSICNKNITIRNRCKHKVGNLYMGEMCFRIVEDVEFLAMAIVKNPFDKYTVLFPKDLEYNYEMLEKLMTTLKTPYDRWYITESKELRPIYKDISRNDKCPCGSNKKYKKCCLGKEKTQSTHYHITLMDNPLTKPIKKFDSHTWKQK